MRCYRPAGRCRLSAAHSCGDDRDTSARIVRRTGCRRGRCSTLGAVIATTASVALLLPPVSITDVRERGDPALSTEFYAPLLNQLVHRGATGPIEVVPTLRRGGCLCGAGKSHRTRVVATSRHRVQPHLLRRNPQPDTYRKWLDDNAISYVALSSGPHEWAATDEANLRAVGCHLRAGVVGTGPTLYAVANPRPVTFTSGTSHRS